MELKDLIPPDFVEHLLCMTGFPGGSDGKESACNAGYLDSTSGSGRSLGEGTGYPLQYSCLENSLERGAWWATVHRVANSPTHDEPLTLTMHDRRLRKV